MVERELVIELVELVGEWLVEAVVGVDDDGEW